VSSQFWLLSNEVFLDCEPSENVTLFNFPEKSSVQYSGQFYLYKQCSALSLMTSGPDYDATESQLNILY
jgi:hypothetical protein